MQIQSGQNHLEAVTYQNDAFIVIKNKSRKPCCSSHNQTPNLNNNTLIKEKNNETKEQNVLTVWAAMIGIIAAMGSYAAYWTDHSWSVVRWK
jgi:hypothetical protein